MMEGECKTERSRSPTPRLLKLRTNFEVVEDVGQIRRPVDGPPLERNDRVACYNAGEAPEQGMQTAPSEPDRLRR